ncbi:MAG: hypothetical protein JWO94_2182 [Verrucomicrobiaceae bacterium]|nr:hypothetical protein [Verrucomicrobiaceae bacterium]
MVIADVVEKMVGEPIKIAPSQSTGVKMENLWGFTCPAQTKLKFRKKIVCQLI